MPPCPPSSARIQMAYTGGPPRRLVHRPNPCYCQSGLETPDFSQSPLLPFQLPALPLPPLPPGHGSQAGALGVYDSRPRKPAVWPVFVVIVIAIVAYLGASIIAAILYTAFQQPPDGSPDDEGWRQQLPNIVNEPGGIAALAFASQLSFLVVTLCAAWLSPRKIVRRLRLTPSTLSWVGYLTLPVAMFSVNLVFDAAINLFHVEKGGSLQMLNNTFSNLTPRMLVLMILLVGIMPGFAEEFFFRGYIQTRFSERWGRWVGILIAASLFSIAHFDKLQSTVTFFMGIYLGYLVERSGSIRPSMFAHVINNSTAVVLAWLAGAPSPMARPPMPPSPRTFRSSKAVSASSCSCCVACTCDTESTHRSSPRLRNRSSPSLRIVIPRQPLYDGTALGSCVD